MVIQLPLTKSCRDSYRNFYNLITSTETTESSEVHY
jgi:hypothetical protein